MSRFVVNLPRDRSEGANSVIQRVETVQIVELSATMRPFLSRLSSEMSRLWLLCGAFLFGSRIFAYARLSVWSDEVEERSSLLPLWSKTSSGMDDVEGKTKGQSISSSQTVRELQSNLENQRHERTRHLKLHQQFDRPLLVPPMHGIYNWSDHLELPNQGQGVVLFSTDCSNDVHVAFSPQPQSANPMYEFVIGGWSNTQSVVRRKSQGPNLCTVPTGLNKPRLDTVNDLWISINKNTRLLRMGHGKEPSFESVFFIYKDPWFLLDAQYICFTTWDVPVTYSNIIVLAID